MIVTLGEPGNNRQDAHNFGTIIYNLTPPLLPPTLNEYLDSVGGDDNDDYFQFSLDQKLGVVLNLSLPVGVTIELLDNLGEVIVTESNPVDPFNTFPLFVSLNNNLDAGTYYIHLFSDNADATTYDFDLRVAPPDNAGDSDEEANDLGILSEIPVVVEDYVGSSNSYNDEDYYQFTLSELSTVNFEITDGDNNFTNLQIYAGTDTFGNPIDSLFNSSSENIATLEKTLVIGTYTVKVTGNGLFNPLINDSNLASYSLSLSATPSDRVDPGNRLATAHNFGNLTYNLTPPLLPPAINEYLDSVGGGDNDDYFQFSLDQSLGVEVNLSLLRGVTIELLDDLGEVIVSESNPIDPFNDYPLFVSLKDNLDAGTYYIHLFSDNADPTLYDFDLIVAPPDNAGDSAEEANNLGMLTATPVVRDDYVGSSNDYYDPDYYQFTLSELSTVNFELSDGDDNYTYLDIYSGTDIFGSFIDSLINDDLDNLSTLQRTLAPGTYTVSVGGVGSFNPSTNESNLASYSLSLSATPTTQVDPGNSLDEAHEFGNLTYNLTPPLLPPTVNKYLDLVGGEDNDDYFQFSLDQSLGIEINLSLLRGVTIELLDDLGEVIVSESNPIDPFNDYPLFVSLQDNLDAGTYYIHLFSDNADPTVYDFDLIVAPPDNAGDFGDEANDLGILTATPVVRDDYVGSSDDYYDQDYYQFTLSELSTVNFELSDGDDNYTYLDIYSGTDTFGNSIGSLFNNYLENLTSLQTTLGAGTYTVRIGGDGGYNESIDDYNLASYSLSVATTEQPDPVLTISDVTFFEGDEGTTNAVFSVSLNPNSETVVTVDYSTADDSALAGSDYVATSGTLTFNPGELNKSIIVPIIGDELPENTEQFFVNLSNASNVPILKSQGIGTIIDSDVADVDLVISSPSTDPITAKIGDGLTFTWTVTNNGTDATTADRWFDYIYISDDAVYDVNDTYVTGYLAEDNLPLNPGQSYEVTRFVTLPETEIGDRYLLIITDLAEQQTETDETNNTIAIPLQLEAAPDIDLIVSAIDAPTEGVRGGNINISWTVENLGTVDTGGGWFDYLYLSTDQELGNEDDIFLTSYFNNILLAEDSVENTVTVEINPSIAEGNYYILVDSDRFDEIIETDETNNQSISTETINIVSPDVDLIVSEIDAPAEGVRGESIPISWTVENIGTVDAAEFMYDSIYLSPNNIVGDEDDIFINRFFFDEIVTAGDSSVRTTNLFLPHSVENGDYYVVIGTDSQNNIIERDDTNNFKITEQIITLTSPDLIVSDVIAPVEGLSGQEIEVSWTITNGGNTVTNGTWYDSIYFSEDTTINSADTRLQSFEFTETLNPGESITRVQTVTLPIDLQGDGYIGVAVDDFGYIVESDEENNTGIDSQGFTGILSPYPNLIVSEINAPINAFTKQQIPIEWTVTNTGNGATNASYWTDQIWLSVDTVLDSSDTYLGQATNPSYLEPGQSYTNSLTVNVPKNIQGNYYFIVETDVSNRVFEFESENDNSNFGGPTIIEPSPIPDLQVTDVNGPMQVFSGQSTEVTYTVSNEGEGDTIEEGWSDRIYLSSDQVIDDNDYLVGFHRRHTIYEIYVTDTYFNGSGDLDREYLYTTVTSDSYSSEEVSTLIANLQRPLTSRIFNPQEGVYFYEQIGLRNTRLETYPGQLNAGESYQVTKNVTLPIGVSGEFYFVVETDINNEVDEQAFESNNTGSTTELTTVRLTPPPDLELEFLNVPNTALASHELTIDYRVTNFGTETPNYFWRDTLYLSEDDQLDRETDLKLGDYFNYQKLGIVNSNEQFINSYDANVTFTLPDEITGDYYLFAVTDSEDQVFELDNENNIVRHSNLISIESRPADLIITNLAVIGAIEAGKGIQVQWTVENVGIGDTAVNNWSDRIIASVDGILGNDDDIILGTIYHQLRTVNDAGNVITVPFLNPGESYSKTAIINIPITLVGDYNLFAVTDVNNNVYEATNEDNNTRQIPILVTRETADLQVTELTVANSVNSGKPLTVNYTVQNLGTAETNNNTWRDRIYLSADTELGDSNDIELGTVYRSQKLASLENYTIARNFTIPIDLEGDYYVIVETDGNNNILEDPSENNNTKVSVNPTNIILSEVPDLVIREVASPDTAISGQQVNISWNTHNDGEDIVEGNWRTTFYLSRDQIFEPNLDTYIGYANYQGDLLSGETLNQSQSFLIPRGLSGQLYVFAVTDNNKQIYEREGESNNVAYDGTSMTVSLAPPADLVVRNITVPVNGVPGELTTIEYTIENQGNSPALGSWRDEVYISADTVWDLNDRKLGTVNVTGPVASGESYTESLTAKLPGVVPANYYVIVRSDIRNAIPEPDESNNIAASSETFLVDTNVLEMDVPRTGTLGSGESVYYRMDAPVGETLQLKFDSASLNGANELYVRYGEMPTRTEYDFSFSDAFAPDQEIIVPNTKGGSYYVLAYGDRGLSADYTIEAEILDFSLLDVGTDYGSNRGQVTTTLLGAEFTPDTDVRLIAGDGTTRDAVQLWWKDQTELWATFDLQGLDTGLYDVEVMDGDESAILEDSFTVTDGAIGEAEITMSAPPALRPGQAGVVTIAYRNVGETDIVAPLITLAAENANLRSPDSSNITASELQFLGINSEGPAGILAPGATETINVVFNPTGGNGSSVGFTLSDISDPNAAYDLSSFEDALRPEGLTDTDWDNIWQNFLDNIGETAGDYNAVLADNASHLSQIGDRTKDVPNLLNFEFLQASGYGSLIERNTIGSFGRGWPSLLAMSAITDIEGNVTIEDENISLTFELQPDGTYLSPAGDGISLVSEGGVYLLSSQDGSTIGFNSDGTLDYIEDIHGNRLQTTYTDGRLTELSSDNGDRSLFEYNEFGRISQVSDQAGRVSTYSYDATGEYLLSVATPEGTIAYTYDTSDSAAKSAITSITYPDGTQRLFEYDEQGRLSGQSLGDGSEALTYEYDSAGGITVTDASGASVELLLTNNGQIGQLVDDLGRVTQYHYDDDENLTEIIQPDGTTTSYEYDQGTLVRQIDGLGNETEFSYDPIFERLSTVRDALGNAINYSYDDTGNLDAITYADGNGEQYNYDAQGRLIESINRRGQSILYDYNQQDQLISKTFEDSSQVDYTYDLAGNLTSATDANGTTNFEYDSGDRLTRITYPNGRFVAYSYDDAGRRSQMIDQNGFTVNYSYNEQGRLARLTDGADQTLVAYQYDSLGRLSREDNGNGTYTTYEYDSVGQTTSVINYAADDTINSRFDYTYNEQGLRTSMTTLEGTWNYGYDAIGQLTSVTLPDGNTIEYQYDAAGNRIAVTDNGVETNYVSNNLNQYSSAGDTSFTYDTDGNLISKTQGGETWTYTYDAENRLVAVDAPDGSWTYEYDIFGHRIASIHNGERTEYLVDPLGNIGLADVIGEYDNNGNLVANYVHGIGLETRIGESNEANYFDFDALGSTAGLSGAAGNYVNQYRYLPFGEDLSKTEGIANPFEYVGQWGVMDEAHGLDFMRARYYDPQAGRFINPDPIGINGGLNLYRYVNNNPTNFVDPSGLICWKDIGTRFSGLLNIINGGIGVAGFGALAAAAGVSVAGVGVITATAIIAAASAGWAIGTGINQLVSGDSFGQTGNLFEDIGNGVFGSNGGKAGAIADGLFSIFSGRIAKIPTSYLESEGAKNIARQIGRGQELIAANGALGRWLEALGIKPEDCDKDPPDSPEDNDPQKDNTDIVRPSDPNDILGPEGFGEERWITASETLPYTIRFENQETATAPAQQVIITHPLDSDLDFRTFRLGNFGWSDYYFEVPENSAFYQETLDLTEEEGFVVEVVAGVDIEAGEAFWNITTLDPETGQTPEDALTGFLLPNNDEGVGDGFVTYTIKSSRNAQSGDIIDAEATIIFDTEEPIDTPPIFNTIDAEIPTSTVNPIPEPNENHEFLVSWTGNDDLEGSGLQGYNIYVSDNGGDYTLWLENTQLTEALYTGTPGHTYDFYSVAFDNAGNQELTPAEAQASVAIANNEITLDIDGNGILELQDYNLIDLYASGLDETEFDFLINNFSNDLIGENATRPDANSILSYFNEVGDTLLDIDGNTQVELQDYNLIDLYASQLDVVELGFLIENFSNDLIGENATRSDADSILTYFETIVPETV